MMVSSFAKNKFYHILLSSAEGSCGYPINDNVKLRLGGLFACVKFESSRSAPPVSVKDRTIVGPWIKIFASTGHILR